MQIIWQQPAEIFSRPFKTQLIFVSKLSFDIERSFYFQEKKNRKEILYGGCFLTQKKSLSIEKDKQF